MAAVIRIARRTWSPSDEFSSGLTILSHIENGEDVQRLRNVRMVGTARFLNKKAASLSRRQPSTFGGRVWLRSSIE
jgi:hypothetical protein